MKKFWIFLLLTLCLTATTQAQVTNVANLPGGNPIGTALRGTDLYVSVYNQNRIVKIDLTQPFPVTPVTILPNVTNPIGLTVFGDYLYFGTGNTIPGFGNARVFRINLNNPSPVIEMILDNSAAEAEAFARVGDTLYISSETEGILRVNLSQPFPQTPVIVNSSVVSSGIAIRGNELYYGHYNSDKVQKINRLLTNSIPTTVVSGLAGPDGLTLSGNFLYISEAGGDKIRKIDVTQPNPTVETVVSGLSGPTLTVFDGLSIYFGQQNNGDVSRLSVNALSFSPPAPVCITQSAALRTGGSPLGGIYSGPNVTNSGNGETFSFNAQAAGPGNHTVTYTFGALTSTASITVASLPNVSAASTNISCAGLNNGQALAAASGGVSYLWSNGATTAGISSLAAGLYTVTITNAGGCQATASVTITEPPALTMIATTTPNVGTMNNGTATANATGGTTPYTYAWTTGATTVTITGLSAGLYNVTVTDANGCTRIETANVQQQAAIPGDACSSAISINNLFGTAIGDPVVSMVFDNTGAHADGDPSVDLATCFFQSDPLQHTLWFSFTGNGNRYRIRTVPGAATSYIQNGDTQAALYTGACASPAFVSCNDDEDANNNIFNINFEVITVAGQEYRLLLDGYGGSQGQFSLEVTRIVNVEATEISATPIRLAPNPSSGIVQLSNVMAEEIQVLDAMGRMVQHLTQPGNTVDLSSQPAGLYLLQLREQGKWYTARVLKQ